MERWSIKVHVTFTCSSPVFVLGDPVTSVGRLAFSERPTGGV
ncbi:hypothetical protein [Odoribacter sp. N54.MGS-14]|nr:MULTISPECIES: hypothetical protein [Odoribacter]